MYTVTDLAPSGVTGISEAFALNNGGMVVGQLDTAVGFVWTPNQPNDTTGSEQRLPTLMPVTANLPSECVAFAINSTGDIVGRCETVDASSNQVNRAFLFRGGAMTDLGTFIPDPANPGLFLGNSEARGINDTGQIVGLSDDILGSAHAFFLDTSATPRLMRDLFSLVPPSMLPGPPDPSVANAINSAGLVVGTASAADAAGNIIQRAFFWTQTSFGLTDLGTLVPDPANPGSFLGESSAQAVNDAGQIAGDSDSLPPGVGTLRLAVTFGQPPVVLMAGPNACVAMGINDNPAGVAAVGWFVSSMLPSGPLTSGLFVSSAKGVVDLNTQLATADWTIQKAMGINNSGQICGIGTHATLGGPRAILLTLIP